MSLTRFFGVAALLALTASQAMPADTPAGNAVANPFFTASTLPFQYPVFDRIRPEHFAPAFAEGMRQQLAEIDAIANNPQAPTFDNTVVAMERSGQLLDRVSKVFFNLTSADTNDALDAIERDLAPKLAAHRDRIYLNDKLFARIAAVYQDGHAPGLDDESRYLVKRYYTDFVRAGAKLNAADKEKLKALNGQIAALETQFSQNVLKETNAMGVVVNDRKDLAGLSDAEIAAAADTAKARGLEGKYVLALVNTTGQPQQENLVNRAVREQLYQASVARGSRGGEFDNRNVVLKLTRLRAEQAQLLGYENYAQYVLEDETAKTVGAVNKILSDLAGPSVANARKEAAAMQPLLAADHPGAQLAPWDWAYYTEKVRKQRYNFDGAQLRPYFELNSVLQNGVFYAANRLYGLTFKERHDLPVYHKGVRVFDVFDADGKPLAIFIGDYYARPSKHGGAWMNEYMSQSSLLGTHPVVANHLNIPEPPAGQPTLLTFDEVTTMFHEFGHALHGMMSNVRYPRFSGTNVPRDFVEYPSQYNEMWAVWPEVLKNYAHHYKTGEPMPAALLDKVLETQKFNQGFATTEYLSAAILDQRWHQLTPAQIPADPVVFENTVLHEAGVDYGPVPPRYRTTYFSHAFSGGYAAGYYAYIWSDVLATDTVEWFKQHGGLSRKSGDWFRQHLLSRGGSMDAIEMFKQFSGREPYVGPLLESRGLTAPASK